MQPGEVEANFGPYFAIEKLAERTFSTGYVGGEAVYLMTRNEEENEKFDANHQ